ncbi:uncharacterized protein LOC115989854 [Quercus lobata]|uniref:uncharacterized protein LOC115989854 n=1 Tax=Quercus lobata TaxID=97700 RepID=UPI00124513B2|nr:uncharacterized protein LOC115989854 [Quercus lobata]
MKSAFKVMDTCLWYLNSGCSRHMIGDQYLFKVFESKKGGNVTFGDGNKSQIKVKGIISLPRLPDIANVLYVEGTKKTPYELWKERKPNVKYFIIFASTCFVLKDRENVGKFNSRSDEGIFLGYSSTSKAYRVYNKRTMKVMETVNVVIDESSDSGFEKFSEEISKEILPPEPREIQEIVKQEPVSPSTPSTPSVVKDLADISTSLDSESHEEKGPSSRIKLNHPPKVIMGNMNELTLRKRAVDKCVANFVFYSCYFSHVEPTRVEEAF